MGNRFEYWERFKKLCASFPHHQISEKLLLQYFYEGLAPMEWNIIDVTSEGPLVDKTSDAVRALISNMAANSQQFGIHFDTPIKVNEVTTTSPNLDQKITELTVFVHKLVVN